MTVDILHKEGYMGEDFCLVNIVKIQNTLKLTKTLL